MLRNGAFDENEPLEPMSEHKWRKIWQMAVKDNVTAYLKGDEAHPYAKQASNPGNVKYDIPDGRTLRRITEKERHAMDTSVASLELLNIMTHTVEQTLNRRASLRMIIELGVFLRKKGDRVDYIKIEKWLRKLGIRRLMELHASVLIVFFNFNISELPFMHRCSPLAERFMLKDRKLTTAYLFKYPASTMHSWLKAVCNVITQIEE